MRVGLLLDGPNQPNWILRLIREVVAAPFADAVVVFGPGSPPKHERSASHLLYRAYRALDDRLFRSRADALEVQPITDVIADCEQVTIDLSDMGDARRIRALELDVLLNLGPNRVQDQRSRLAKHGTWWFQHGDDGVPAASAGFWEVMEGRLVTRSALLASDGERGAGLTIYQSYAPTDNRSVRRNRNNYLWKTSAFFLRKLEDLHAFGRVTAFPSQPPAPIPNEHPHGALPGNRHMAALMLNLAARYVGGKLHGLIYLDQWFIAYSGPAERGLGNQGVARAFTYLLPAKAQFWADPFPFRDGDATYIFLEEFERKKKKAHISVVRMEEHGLMSTPEKVLERPYHLSYPFVFEWDGGYYMMPETRGNRTVELYRAREFPLQWEPAGVLLSDINAADATLAEMDGRWWLFVNVAVDGSANADELHLYSADTPLGPWVAHPANPVKSDARSARPAGRVFYQDGAYYRPAQDCSGRYGRALVLNRILRLDREQYLETEVGRIEPNVAGNLLGTHTLNMAGDLLCLDGVIGLRRIGGRLGSARQTRGYAVLARHAGANQPQAVAGLAPRVGPCGFWLSGAAAELVTSGRLLAATPT